jgi:hypothetical protein
MEAVFEGGDEEERPDEGREGGDRTPASRPPPPSGERRGDHQRRGEAELDEKWGHVAQANP